MTTEQQTTRPSEAQVRAAISLLSDPDPRIAQACRETVLSWGERSRVVLEQASKAEDPSMRMRARHLLRSLQLRQWLHDVTRFASRVGHGVLVGDRALERGAFLISSFSSASGGPGAVDAFRTKLASLAIGLAPLVEDRSSQTAARNLGHYFAAERGLRGASDRPLTPALLSLEQVMTRGLGHPVALAILYLLVGRRVGLQLTAVRMPDHFLVRVHGKRRILVDPFHGGRTVTRHDCLRHLRRSGHSGAGTFLVDMDDADVLREYVEAMTRSVARFADAEIKSVLRQAALHLTTV